MLSHVPPQDWCEFCVSGYASAKAHKSQDFDKRDLGKPSVMIDFAYMKTDGEFADTDTRPSTAELYSTSLVMVDVDTGCVSAAAVPTKSVTEYLKHVVTNFCTTRLNHGKMILKSGNEPAFLALKAAVQKARGPDRPTAIQDGSLKDSANMGAVESSIRWWQ